MVILDKDNVERTTRDSQGRFVPCGAHWTPYDIDPFTRDCECDGSLCNPNTCPRFVDTCCECDQPFGGSGFMCLDGGETACVDCIEFRTDSDGNRY